MAGREEGNEDGLDEQAEGIEDEGSGGEESTGGDSDLRDEAEDEEELLENEDAIQTAARLLGKRKSEDSEATESSEEEPVLDEKEDASTEQDSDDTEAGAEKRVDEDIEPPIRLTAEAKKAFKAWPSKAKKEFVSAVKNLESTFNRSNQELVTAKKDAEHIMQAVRPYYTSKPELAAKGITEAQVVTGLIGNHQLLTHDDVNVRRQKFLAIGKSIGLIDEDGQFVDADSGGARGQININEAVKTALQTEIAPIKSFVESQQKTQQQAAADKVVAELQTVMNETDNLGNYVYPELHDQDYHAQQVQPLVAGLVRSIPNLGYADATKLAVQRLRLQNGKSAPPNPTRLPTNKEEHKERAARAGVSSRGKAAASSGVDKLTPLQETVMDQFPIGGR